MGTLDGQFLTDLLLMTPFKAREGFCRDKLLPSVYILDTQMH